MRFLNKKPNAKMVVNNFGERANDISNNITQAQLDLGVTPKFDIDGKIVGFEPSAEFIQRETRKYHIFGRVIEVSGTVYGIAKNDNGKFGGTYFMPDMAQGEVTPDEYMRNLFASAKDILQLLIDMTYWQMPARTLSKVANEGNCSPEVSEFIGEKYAMNLFSDDEIKFSRAMFLQYVQGEKDIFKELYEMQTSGGNPNAGVIVSSNAGAAFVERNEAINILNPEEGSKVRKFGNKKFSALGGKEVVKPVSKFGLKKTETIANAGKSALNLKK